MKTVSFPIFVFCCLALLLNLSGCKEKVNPDGRLDVTGRITLNGKSLEGASLCKVTFTSLDSPDSETLVTTFNGKTGQYSLTMQDGLKPGRYRVKFYATAQYDRKTKKPVTPTTLDTDVYVITLIPKEFNEDSTVEFEAVAGKKNIFDYDIKGDLIFEEVKSKHAFKPPE